MQPTDVYDAYTACIRLSAQSINLGTVLPGLMGCRKGNYKSVHMPSA